MIIVLAKIEQTGMRPTGRLRNIDQYNRGPEFEACAEAKACVWKLKGSDKDVPAALAFAKCEGYTVFQYPSTERKPLERARAEIMRQY